MTDIAIIGAGPYGLSLAAYLNATGQSVRIFGTPMQTWQEHMPEGMMLKSDGFASNLYDPASAYTLRHFCDENKIPYQDMHLPVPLQTFVDYGIAFQHRLAPNLEQVNVTSIRSADNGFQLELANGETFTARRVISATGISNYDWMPDQFRPFPRELVSHTANVGSFDRFKGKEVAVVGGGSSAVDTAASLARSGANVTLVARRQKLRFHDRPTGAPRTLAQRIRRPDSGLGPGWRSRLSSDAPMLFHVMPESMRLKIVQRHLGPAPGWFVREQVDGRIPMLLSSTIESLKEEGGRVHLNIRDEKGTSLDLQADHVICGTGYKVSLERLPYLTGDLRNRITTTHDTPVLTRNFETSVPGLYFTGLAAANSFGPLLRFAYGAGFTSKQLARHLSSRR